MRSRFAILLGGLLLCTGTVQAEQRWYRIELESVHAGYALWQRQIEQGVVRTQLDTQLKIASPNGTQTLHQMMVHEETLGGQPLRFEWQQSDGQSLQSIHGEIRGEQLHVTHKENKSITEQTMTWSQGWLFPYAYEQGMRSQLKSPQWSYRNFDVQSLSEEHIQMQIKSDTNNLYRIDQISELGGNTSKALLRLDDQARMQELKQWVNGVPIRWTLTARENAVNNLRAFDQSQWNVLQSPYRISDEAVKGRIRYELSVPVEMREAWPQSAEQKVSITESGVRIEVCADCKHAADEVLLDNKYLISTRWLDYQTPVVRRLASKPGTSNKNPQKIMQALTRTVRDYLVETGPSMEFLTASQTARFQRGDCNEHARLLASLGRVRGIRTRVVAGLVYRDTHSSRKAVFAPHSWVQAWIDGRWISYDAAMGFFGAGHIMLAVGEGDPAIDQAALERISRYRIISAAQIQQAKK